MRILLCGMVCLGLVAPACAGDAATAKQLAEMQEQIRALSSTVKTLQAKLAAQDSRTAASAETSTKGAGDSGGDELEATERKLGYAGDAAPAPAKAAVTESAGAAARDDLEALESRLGYSGGVDSGRAAAAAAGADRPPVPTRATPYAPTGGGGGGGGGNARTYFNPLISVIGDFVYRDTHLQEGVTTGQDLNPITGRPTNHVAGNANDNKLDFRELEIAFQSVIDPWARLDVFLTMPGLNGDLNDTATAVPQQQIEIEEAYLTYTQLPWGLVLKGGKFRPEFGKENLTHTHVFFSVDRPSVITNFFGRDGLKEYGLSLQKSFSLDKDNRSILELTGQAMTDVSEDSPFSGAFNHGMLWLGRARYYHEFDDSNNIDFGVSHISGDWDQLEQREFDVTGLDLTYRHEPIKGGVYHKTLARAEYLRGERDVTGFIQDPVTGRIDLSKTTENPDGFYALLNHQFQRNMWVGARYDDTDAALMMARTASPDGVSPGFFINHSRIAGPSLWYEYETTEFNRFKIEYSHHDTDFAFADNRRHDDALFVEWTVTAGPHGAHKY